MVAAASLAAATIPVITAVVNSANYRAEIASGSWATIVGTGLSNTTRAWKESDFINGQLPPELDFISVTVNGRPAFVGYISPNQINFWVLDDLVLGASTVQCAGQLLQSNFFIVNKVSYSPSLFPLTGKYAVAVHLDGTLAGPTGVLPGPATTPSKPKETVQLLGTGFGPRNRVIATGALFNAGAPLAKSVTATVGGRVGADRRVFGGTGVVSVQFDAAECAGWRCVGDGDGGWVDDAGEDVFGCGECRVGGPCRT